MKNLPRKFIVSRSPKEYLRQGLSHCGVYSIKGIFSAYGKDDKENPEDYHPSWFGKITGFSPPSSLIRVLRSRGLDADFGEAKSLSQEAKLNFLKELISNDTRS